MFLNCSWLCFSYHKMNIIKTRCMIFYSYIRIRDIFWICFTKNITVPKKTIPRKSLSLLIILFWITDLAHWKQYMIVTNLYVLIFSIYKHIICSSLRYVVYLDANIKTALIVFSLFEHLLRTINKKDQSIFSAGFPLQNRRSILQYWLITAR